jgi:hypothetical protein
MVRAIEITCAVFLGLTAFVAWADFWVDRGARRQWPTWICVSMGFALPIGVVIGLGVYFAPILSR